MKLYEYLRQRIRVYLKVLLPVDLTFLSASIHFNMHVRNDVSSSSLYPVSSLNDVAKVFFTNEEFEIWNDLLQSHGLYSPS